VRNTADEDKGSHSKSEKGTGAGVAALKHFPAKPGCRVGLVLGGGGAKGAYQIGVYKALRELGADKFECIAGTSIGALNALLFSTESSEQAELIWLGLSQVLKHSRSVLIALTWHGLTYAFIFLPVVLTVFLIMLYAAAAMATYFIPGTVIQPTQLLLLHQSLIICALGIASIGYFSRTWEFSGAATIFTFDPRRIQIMGEVFVFLLCVAYLKLSGYSFSVLACWIAAFVFWALWSMSVVILSRKARQFAFLDNEALAILVRERLSIPRNEWRSKAVFATIARETSFFHPILKDDGDSEFFKIRNGLAAQVGRFVSRWVPLYVDLHSEKPEFQADVLLSSAAIPLGFPMKPDFNESRSHGERIIPLATHRRWLCDGGVVDNLPLTAAVNLADCDMIVVVALNQDEVPPVTQLQHHSDTMWSSSVVPFLTNEERKTLLAKFEETGEWLPHVPGRRRLDHENILAVVPSRPLCTINLPILRFFTGTLNFEKAVN